MINLSKSLDLFCSEMHKDFKDVFSCAGFTASLQIFRPSFSTLRSLGVYFWKLYAGRFRPEVQPYLPFCIAFWQKSYPFVYISLKNLVLSYIYLSAVHHFLNLWNEVNEDRRPSPAGEHHALPEKMLSDKQFSIVCLFHNVGGVKILGFAYPFKLWNPCLVIYLSLTKCGVSLRSR